MFLIDTTGLSINLFLNTSSQAADFGDPFVKVCQRFIISLNNKLMEPGRTGELILHFVGPLPLRRLVK